MNSVQPIRDMSQVMDMAEYLLEQSERNYIMFMIGIYTCLRISDILNLRVRDVKDKEFIYLREKKTGKERKIAINKKLRKAINHYVAEKKDFEYLIKTPEHVHYNKPISRQQAYNIIHQAAAEMGIERVGPHTMRKTFGYHLYKKTGDAALLMKMFNHADIHTTLRYIGIEQDDMDKAVQGFSYD